MNTNITKTMPPVTGGSTDRSSMFTLGRRAFFNKTYNSHLSTLENRDYSGGLRIQRLRLNAIGSGSSKLKNADDKLQFNKGRDNNLKNSPIYVSVRGSGGGRPKR